MEEQGSASTPNQALAALVVLYKDLLEPGAHARGPGEAGTERQSRLGLAMGSPRAEPLTWSRSRRSAQGPQPM